MANNRIDMTVGLKVDKSGLSQLKKSLQDIQGLTTRDLMNINGGNFNKAKEDLKTVKSQAEKVEAALKQAFNPKLGTVNVEAFNNVLKKSSGSIETIYSNFKKAGASGEAAFRNMASQLAKVQTQVKQTHGWLDKMAITFANTVKWNISSSVFNSLTGSIQQAWNFTKALDSSLNDIRIVTGKSAEEMDRFAVKANAAARELGATTKDYTNASLIFAQQGLSDKEIEAKTNVTLKVANVTGQDAAAVSEQLTAVWNGYKVGAGEAELYADRLAAVASKSASNLQELATGMSKVASAAATMGVSEEQLAAQLSTIISVTRQAPESVGVALKTVYARMSDIKAGLDEDGVSLGNYSGKMAAFGINVLDMSGNLRDMGEVIEEIGGKWGTMTRQQQVSLAQTMGGQRQYSNLVALFDNFDKYQNMVSVAQNAEGTLEKQNETYMDRLTTHITQMTAATEKLFMTLVDSDGFKDLIDIFTQLIELTSGFVDSIGGLGPILGMLGGVGAQVFGKDIAKNLTETIAKMGQGKKEAEDFSKQIEALQKMKDVQGLSSESKEYIGLEQKKLEHMPSMTGDQRTEIGQRMEALNVNVENLDNLREQKLILEQTLKILGEASGETKTLDDIIAGGPDTTEKLKTTLQSKEATYKSFFETIQALSKQTRQAFMETDSPEGQIDVAKARLEKIQKALKEIVNQNMNEQGEAVSKELDQYLRRVQIQINQYRAKLSATENSLKQAQERDTPVNDFEAQKVIRDANLSELQQIEGLFSGFIAKMQQNTHQLAENIEEDISTVGENLNNGIKQAENAIAEGAEEINGFYEDIDAQTATQSIVDIAGGVSQVYGALQSIASLGDVWGGVRDGASFGQALLKTFSSLLFVVPSLITGFTVISTGLNTLKNAEVSAAFASKVLGETIKEGTRVKLKDVIVAKLLGISIKDVGDKTVFTALKTVIAEHGFKSLAIAAKALYAALGPVGIALGAVAIAATAFSFINNAIEQSRQKSIQANNEIIEQEKEKQQQYEKIKEGFSALKQLNSQYENGQISVTELKTKTQELAEQYKIEDQLIKTLTEDYSKFGEILDGYSDRILEIQVNSAKRARISAGINVKNAVEETGDRSGWFTNLFSPLTGYTVSSVKDSSDESKSIWEKYLKGLDFVSYDFEHGETVLSLSRDPEKAKQQYEELSRIMQQFTKEQANSALGQFLTKQTTTIKDSIDKYSEAVSFQLEQATEKLGNQFADEFSNVKSVEEYSKVRDAFVTELARLQEISEEEAAKAVDAYLRTYQKQLYNKFSLRENLYKKLKDASGKDASEKQAQLLDNLSQDKLVTLQNIKFDNWEEFYNICSKLDDVDLSNLFISDISTDNISAAKDQFDFYQSFADQMANSKKNTIGEKQFKSLDSDIQEFFFHTAQNTYKLKAGAIQFYDAVTRKSRESLEQVTEDSIKRQDQLLNISAMLANGEGTEGYSVYNNAENAEANTKLQLIVDQGWGFDNDEEGERQKRAVKWAAAIQHGSQEAKTAIGQMDVVLEQNSKLLDSELVSQYVKKLEQASKKSYAAQYELGMAAKDTAELKDLLDQKKIGIDAYNAAYVDLKKQTEDKILDPKEVSEYADHLQKIAKNSKDLSDDLKENRKDALALASEIMKMNKGIQNLAKNWKNWGSILRKSSDRSQEFGEALEGVADALALITGMDKTFFDEEFVKANLDNIEKVANGDEKAIQRVKDAAAQKILITVTGRIEDEKLRAQMLKLGEDVLKKGQEISNTLKVGAQLDPTKQKKFIADLNKLIETTGMTTGQLNSMLSDIGFQPVFSTEEQPVETEIPETITKTTVDLGAKRRIEIPGFKIPFTDIDIPGTSFDIPLPSISTSTEKTGTTKKVTQMEVPSLSTNGKAAPIKSLRKKATPSMNNYSSKNKGGSSPSGKSGGGGGKKGGGRGSGNKADKSQKDTKKIDKKQQDIYHDINIELKDINRALERTQKIQEKLYGKELLDNLQKQSDLLDEHIKKLREKEALQKIDLKNKQAELKTLGMTFDEYGHITNYLEKLTAHQNKINKLTKEYNAIVKKYNASTNKSTKEKLNQQMTAKDKQIKQAEEAKKETEEKIKDYEELQDAREELLDQIEEELDKQTEIAIKKFRMQLEVRLETGDAEREWNDFKRNVLNADDVLKTSSFSTIMRDAQKSLEDFGSYFDVAGAKGSITILTEQVKATKQQIEDIDKLGESAIYGKNKAQAMEDLKTDLSDLMSKLGEAQELIKALDQAYLDGMADIKEQYNNRQEQLGFIGELVQHDMDLLGIIFGSKNYAAMQKYYETLRQNQNSQINLLREESNYWKDKWEQALRNGNTNAAKQFENNYKDSINNLNSLIDTAAQTLKDKYLNAIDAIFDQVNNKLTSGKGLDYLDLEWNLINKNAESYLDKINSAYAIQDFQNKSTKAINDAKGLKNQQALKKVSEEQLKILRNKDKLTQYDVDRANKMLELEKARLALEEARQNKTSLRLKRDSQGNYSYQYVSDNNKILEAQEALAKAQNELFNFDAQKYKDNLKEVSEAWKEYQEKVRSILQDEALSEQERSNQLKLVKDKYETYITNKLKENLSIRENLMQSAFDEYSTLYNLDAQKFANMSTAEKDVIMNELVPQWDSGIANMISRLNGDGEQQGLAQAWKDTFEQIKNKEQEFKQEQAELFKEAGIDPEDLQNAFNPIVDVYSDLIETNKEFLNQLDEEKSALENIASQAEKLKDQYKGIFEYAKKSAEEAQKFRTEQEKAAAAAAQAADKTRSKINAQADTKAAQQKAQQIIAKGSSTSVSKASVNNGGNSSSSSKKGTKSNSGDGNVPRDRDVPKKTTEDANFKKIQQLQKKIANYESSLNAAKGHVPAATLSSSFLKPAEKLQKELNSVIKKVQKGNLKDAQKLQTKANTSIKNIQQYINKVMNPPSVANRRTTGIATSQYGLLQPTNTLEKHTIGKDSFGQWVSGKPSFFKKINTFYIENYLGSIWKNYKTHRKYAQYYDNKNKRHFIDVGSFDTGGYTGDWAGQQGRLALLHKKELVLNAKDTKNMLDMVGISKKALDGLREKSFSSLSKLSRTLDFNTGAVEQNVHITASFPNVNSKREIEQAFNDLINLAAQRALKRF